ncbi:MAG: CapA family protein [Polyangiales bacterium]
MNSACISFGLVLLSCWACACSRETAESPEAIEPADEAPSTPPAPLPPSVHTETNDGLGAEPFTLWIGGDVMSSAQIRDAAADATTPAEGIAAMFESLSPLWQPPGHFVMVNLETPATARRRVAYQEDGAVPQGRYAAVRLNAPPYLVEGLRLAGVDAVSLANNHALDQGHEGLRETIEHARGAGLVVSGAGRYHDDGPANHWPITLGQDDTELSVFNFYDAPRRALPDSGELSLALVNERAFESVEACASAHVVVVVHVLGELVREVEDEWRVWAERFIDAGASTIIVHGTHVPMAVERMQRNGKEVVVAWGLGNLLTDMGRMASPRRRVTAKINDPETREGLLARITSSADGLDVAFLPVFETDDRFIRWHGSMPPGESTFWLRPLTACDPAVDLPASWPEPYRTEYADWLSARREHMVEATGLRSESCPSGLLR